MTLQDGIRIVLIGAGATAVMDLWLTLLGRLGVPTLNFAFIGRWVGHLLQGRWRHEAIGKSPPIAGERLWGWLTHYAVGVMFAAWLVGLHGVSWMQAPTLTPALALGVVTVLIPLFVMQPSMGAGFAASKTPTPWQNRLRSLLNHTVFGLGLYAAAWLLEAIAHGAGLPDIL
ncbi:MAG: DUF2938 domain-containing protein [Aquabacterium sp.]